MSEIHAQSSSKLEQILIAKVCEPALSLIPRQVHPNTISLVNHLLWWVYAGLAYWAWNLEPVGRTLALVGAGIGLFFTMVGDCLDGMQARRTKRCSKLGELMDHGLDALAVPLTTIGITFALQLPAWAAAPVHVFTAMVYNAQLVLYHHTGHFVHPRTSGTVCQAGASIGYVALAICFWFFDRSLPWVDLAVGALGIIAIIAQLQYLAFYYGMLKKLVWHHLPSMLLCGGFAALYLNGIIDTLAFLMTVALVSFRMSGSYVLFTIIKRPFNGFDIGIAMWAVAIALAHFFVAPMSVGGNSLHNLLPYLACAYMAARNLIDFARHFSALSPTSQTA
ncbi:MAG: hypothetical protein A2289_02370 [Deltaproteobacteria bacterium RIFOXYA12_FULL_58_15]|nr:MAG: hypothetical protein A2289_02370 [Deltaproteobacteria bacterium RIFOXYA12_FULL_58_15]OGR12102.1 MAG: hypothetical protein A2341_23470 [Deltaproteobacteria bacterium RIFOXYB12_FULL_58_9]